MTPFQALYARPPPLIAKMMLPLVEGEDHQAQLDRDTIAQQIKDNLLKAQERMKFFGDKKRSERQLAVGDMVYVKLQPYRHTSLSIHRHLKLHSKYYGPFRVMERIGVVAYRLLLLEGYQLHPTFHVSQLKKHIGPEAVPNPTLPLLDEHGHILIQPKTLLERRLIPRVQGDISIPVVQWCIKWINLPMENVTWEDAADRKSVV